MNTGEDKKKAEEKFKELNEAHEVLIDPEKRKKYDQLGANWQQGMDFTPPPGYEEARFNFEDFGDLGDFSDFFRTIFGGMGRGFKTGRATHRWTQRGSDVEAELKLTLEEAYKGGRRTLQLSGRELCKTCGGTGISQNAACSSCRGSGLVMRTKSLDVNIPPGSRDGIHLRLRGQGEPGIEGGPFGDLFIRITIIPHKVFTFQDNDIIIEIPVYPWEASLGTKIDIPTLDGTVSLKIPPDSQSGRKLRLRGKGFPKKGGGRGDQYAKLKIIIPTKISESEKECLVFE